MLNTKENEKRKKTVKAAGLIKIGSSVLQRDEDRVQKNEWICLFKLEK